MVQYNLLRTVILMRSTFREWNVCVARNCLEGRRMVYARTLNGGWKLNSASDLTLIDVLP